MKPVLFSIVASLACLGLAQTYGQGTQQPDASAAVSKQTPAELELTFKEMLTNATLTGRWCSIKEGVLTPEKEDKYTIVGITKLAGDNWIVNARIQYNKKDIVAPIPVSVKWAGDTPVLIVDKIPVPGGGTYSARVLFYAHTYAGTWSGGDHGGLLNGLITNSKPDQQAPPK